VPERQQHPERRQPAAGGHAAGRQQRVVHAPLERDQYRPAGQVPHRAAAARSDHRPQQREPERHAHPEPGRPHPSGVVVGERRPRRALPQHQHLHRSAGLRLRLPLRALLPVRGSLSYVFKEWGTRIHGGAGSGFRAPTFNDLFFPGFSDRTLKPEHSFSYDFGVDQRLWHDRVRLGLTYFQNEFRDLISFVFTTTAPFVKGVNIGRARSAGIEFTSQVDVTDTLTLALNYTYTDTENLAIDQLLPREPRHRWNGTVSWRPIPRLTLFTQVDAVTEQFEPTGGASGVYNSGHTRIDVGGTYRLLNRYAIL